MTCRRLLNQSAGILTAVSGFLSVTCAAADNSSESADLPDIIVILADDLGFGDVGALNPDSRIPTPNLDRLAAEGMTFLDAHSPSAVCTPTRYGLLTGRYCWRTRLTRGVLGGYSAPLIDADRPTIGTLLKTRGYRTAAVGKWHLGMEMTRHNDERPPQDRWDGDGNVNFAAPILEGPTTRGFDYFFGVSASFDMAPYVWIENDRFTQVPSKQHPGSAFPRFIRKGPQADDVVFEEALDVLADRACRFITEQTDAGQRFLLYLPLTGPHKPVVPHQRFSNMSNLGMYGDFVMNVDDCVGRVLACIDRAGTTDSTMIIFTSDNGSYMYRYEGGEIDHLSDSSVQAFAEDHHRSNGGFRGTKADIWEGGHRVPFFVRWPGHTEAGSFTSRTMTHTDIAATLAEITGCDLPENSAEDSFSFLPLLKGNASDFNREPVIHHSASGVFAVRNGNWKLIAADGSGGRESPKGTPFGRPFQLFNLDADPEEKNNVIEQHSELATELEAALNRLREAGRSR